MKSKGIDFASPPPLCVSSCRCLLKILEMRVGRRNSQRDTRSKRIDFGHSLSHDARRIVGINRDDSVVNEIW